jgi:hypothetical protein
MCLLNKISPCLENADSPVRLGAHFFIKRNRQLVLVATKPLSRLLTYERETALQ